MIKLKNVSIDDVIQEIQTNMMLNWYTPKNIADAEDMGLENSEIIRLIREGLSIELLRLKEGSSKGNKDSLIEDYCERIMTRSSVGKWLREHNIPYMGDSFPIEENQAEESKEVIALKVEIEQLKIDLEQANSERQFQYMTKDLKLMAEIQRINWKTASDKIKLTSVQLEIAQRINPNAKKANAKATHMGSIINPENK